MQRKPGPQDLLDVSPELMANILGHMEVEVRSRYLEAETVALYAAYCLRDRASVDNAEQGALPFSDVVCECSIFVSLMFDSHIGSNAHVGSYLGQGLRAFR